MVHQDVRLDQVQTHKLVLTAELRQAMAVLQLPVTELEVFVNQQLQENPLLEAEELGDEETPGPEGETGADEDGEPDWSQYFEDASDTGVTPAPDRAWDPVERVADRGATLQEHLLAQMRLTPLRPRDRRIAAYLIGNLDGDGYLQVDLETAGRQLGVPVPDVERVLSLVQTFHPPGVAARDLAECLRLQLVRRGIVDEVLERLIAEHLPDLAEGHTARVARALNVPPEQVDAAMTLLRSLEPRPGRNFSGPDGTRFLVPDVIIRKVGGEYIVLVNDHFIPHLTINRTYQRLLGEGDTVTRRFISTRLTAARWLIRNIEQRRLTLTRVCGVLADRQRAFLDGGRAYLKPLTMKEVADELGLHESTVSRAVANKYAETPRGTFALKFFFASGPSMTTAEAVKSVIADLVRGEDRRRPLSDRQIAEILAGRGMDVSRRTVAKYRDEMHIAPAARRRGCNTRGTAAKEGRPLTPGTKEN
ncbi:MAG: RNA polymerase factor sigma-54 [Thermoanaerobacterales bacterium]|nr:RNA polymerase factor sigma-54 [Thermoanaerobacterales bacterium]